MKKSISRSRSSSGKASGKTVDEYLAAVPEPARTTLNKLRAIVRAALPAEATEVISYGIAAFKYRKVILWYAAFTNHCSVFPTASVIEQLKDELKGYTVSKGTIQFPIDKALPARLLKKLVKARLASLR